MGRPSRFIARIRGRVSGFAILVSLRFLVSRAKTARPEKKNLFCAGPPEPSRIHRDHGQKRSPRTRTQPASFCLGPFRLRAESPPKLAVKPVLFAQVPWTAAFRPARPRTGASQVRFRRYRLDRFIITESNKRGQWFRLPVPPAARRNRPGRGPFPSRFPPACATPPGGAAIPPGLPT